MFVQCYELMKIPSFKNNIQLVAGESGLHRKVTWVYVLQTFTLEGWVHGGEIMFVVNHSNIEQVLKEAILHQLSGVVILKSEQNESYLNEEIITLTNHAQLPLFEMDYDVKILDVTREISTYLIHRQEKLNHLNHFFYNLLFSKEITKKEMGEYAHHFGYRKDQVCFITTLHLKDRSKLAQIEVELQRYLDDPDIHFLSMVLCPRIVILVYAYPDSIKKAKKIIKSTFTILNEKYPDQLYMGIGNITQSLYEVRQSYTKSAKSIELCTQENRIIDYEELGFPRLLLDALDMEQVKEYANTFLGEVVEYDQKNQTDYLETIEVYILNNGNINKSASQLFIHRNTCNYRIAKINQLFGLDLDDPLVRRDILNSLAILKYLD